jgi:hypothetical protein
VSIGQREFLAAASKEKAELEAAVRDLDGFVAQHGERRREVAAEKNQAMADFAAALLPALTAEAIAEAVRRTGCQALAQGDPIAQLTRERATAEQKLAAIDADPRYRDRELLRAPRTGTLVRHVDELREFRGPLADLVDKTRHPRLERLLESGYGTSDYAVGWWRLSYFSDWKAADEILERFPGKHFAEVREDLLEARRSIEVYDEQIADLERQIAGGEALEREHDDTAARLASLPELVLGQARERLVQHVQGLELGDLAGRLADSPDLALLWKRASGLAAKVEYLDRIVEAEVVRPREELKQKLAKTSAEITKWSRPKYASARYPDDQFRHRFIERQGRARRTFERAEKTYQTVYVYDRWDRPSLVENLLWWDIMTHGRWDGGYIPQVASFRESHPDYRYESSHLDDQAAAAATVHAGSDDLLGRDVS